ncbi:hypothetical protein KW805_00355 [Candidatus Pacearchaeota archaeon]|nr:hypothetical protein [Candidatus Pacearchaeota archaeon]
MKKERRNSLIGYALGAMVGIPLMFLGKAYNGRHDLPPRDVLEYMVEQEGASHNVYKPHINTPRNNQEQEYLPSGYTEGKIPYEEMQK